MKIWYGMEMEGELKGIKTLFIGNYNVSFKIIREYILTLEIKHVYFGAGQCSKINPSVVNKVLKSFPFLKYTFEIDVNKLKDYKKYIRKWCKYNLVITVTNNYFYLLKNHNAVIKIQTLTNKHKYLNEMLLIDGVETNMKEHKGLTYKNDTVLE